MQAGFDVYLTVHGTDEMNRKPMAHVQVVTRWLMCGDASAMARQSDEVRCEHATPRNQYGQAGDMVRSELGRLRLMMSRV